jgi:hypothetical protein
VTKPPEGKSWPHVFHFFFPTTIRIKHMAQCKGTDMSGRCVYRAEDGSEYCKQHRPNNKTAPATPTAKPKFSLQEGLNRKARGEALLEAAQSNNRHQFLWEIRKVAVELIKQSGPKSTDDIHIWCAEQGVPIPVNKDGIKTIMTQIFKVPKIFQPVLNELGKPTKKKSVLVENNAREIGIYELNPEWNGTFE